MFQRLAPNLCMIAGYAKSYFVVKKSFWTFDSKDKLFINL